MQNNIEENLTYDEITKKGLKSKTSMIIYGITVSLGGTYYGISAVLFNNFAEHFFSKIFEIKDPKKLKQIESDLAFYFFLGCFLCCLLASFLYENIGRLNSFYLIIILEIINSILFNVKIIEVIIYSRILNGFCGCFWMFLSHLIIKECVDKKYRSVIANSFYIFMTVGQSLAYFFSFEWFLDYWRIIMFLPVFIEIPRLFVMIFFFKFKSPIFLYHKFKDNERKIKIQKNYEIFYKRETAILMTQELISDQQKIKNQKTKKKTTFFDLFKKKYRKQLFLSFLINFLTQITGINVLCVFSTEIFKNLKLPNPELLTFIMSFFSLFAAIFITLFGNKIGKRKPILISLFFQGISWLFVIISYLFDLGFLIVISIYSFILFFSIFIGLQYSYIVSFLPSIGVSFSSIFKWGITIFLLKYVLGIIDLFGLFFVFSFFFVWSFIGFLGFWVLAVDTEGKSDSEILKAFFKEDNKK